MSETDTASLRLMKFSLLLPTYEGKLLEYIVKRGNVDSVKTDIDSKIDVTAYCQSLMNILTLYESDENDESFLVFKSSTLKVLIDFSIYISTLIYNTTFDNLTADDGKHISQSYMQRINNSEVGLTYGEITLNSFAALLEYCHPMEGLTFVDIGSGMGKALIAASLLFGSRLKHIHGIELVPGLYESSITSISKYYDIMTMQFPEIFTCLESCKITAEEGDMLQYGKDNNNEILNDKNDIINDTDDIKQKYNWTKANIILANSTCFPSKLMVNLARCAEQMKKGLLIITIIIIIITIIIGSIVITFTSSLPSEEFTIFDERQFSMSWGTATVYIHKRK